MLLDLGGLRIQQYCQMEESDISGKQSHQHLAPESQEDLSPNPDSSLAQKNQKLNLNNQVSRLQDKVTMGSTEDYCSEKHNKML